MKTGHTCAKKTDMEIPNTRKFTLDIIEIGELPPVQNATDGAYGAKTHLFKNLEIFETVFLQSGLF